MAVPAAHLQEDSLPYLHRFTKASNLDYGGQENPKADDFSITYGTAGFRTNARQLTYVVFRTGVFAALKSREMDRVYGVMITASHNKEADNGVKVIGPMGEMVPPEDEERLGRLVALSDKDFQKELHKFQELRSMTKDNIGLYVGYDTRISSPYLAAAAVAGAELVKVPARNFGLLTTPMLHYIIRCKNDPQFGPAKVDGYYERIGHAFRSLYRMIPDSTNPAFSPLVHVDCANGVGAWKLRELMDVINRGDEVWNAKIVNDGSGQEDKLNENCGADYVKIQATSPRGLANAVGQRCASFDGDADRLIYFDVSQDGSIRLLDGDKIAALLAKFLVDELQQSGLDQLPEIGVVQTAYANGASTKFLQQLLGSHNVACVKTGIKHLHERAKLFDIGIYFEANGHGTVYFSPNVTKLFKKSQLTSSNSSIRRLHLFRLLINETVGDAMSDLLAVEAILKHYNWTTQDWAQQLYIDLPNMQWKVPVTDREVFRTEEHREDRLVEPKQLQSKMDEIVGKQAAHQARCFVRPSGTEQIVRVYVEADSMEVVKQIGDEVVQLVKQHAGSK